MNVDILKGEEKVKIVYSYYVLDIVHKGHLLMMENAKSIAGEDGKLIVGILTDSAVMEKKQRPIVPFEERLMIAKAIKYADLVVPQATYSPMENIMKIRPDVLMESPSHNEADVEKSRKFMESINGRVVILPYYPDVSSTELKNKVREVAKD